jgi:hypothetical protein
MERLWFLPRLPSVPWLRRLVSDLSPQRPGFAPGLVSVGFVMDRVALGQGFLWVLRFYPVGIIPLCLSILGCEQKPVVRLQVLGAASMKIRAFWDIAPRNLVVVDRRFGGAKCLHHQGDHRRSRRKACPSATLSTTSPTCNDISANLGLRGERPATNSLSHATAPD